MKNNIHETAIIDKKAHIDSDVCVGPWSIVGPDVIINSGTWIGSHVVIKGPTKIGKNNKIYQFASIGDDPQDKKYAGERTELHIGDGNIIREYSTINRGTTYSGLTKIGNFNLFMVSTHVAHDCVIGDDNVFSNQASIAGHVIVQDKVILSGFSGVHQFCTVGSYSFISAGTIVCKDVLPFTLIDGAIPRGLNLVGLKRHGFDDDRMQAIKAAYKIIYRNGYTVQKAIKELAALAEKSVDVASMLEILIKTERGIVR